MKDNLFKVRIVLGTNGLKLQGAGQNAEHINKTVYHCRTSRIVAFNQVE